MSQYVNGANYEKGMSLFRRIDPEVAETFMASVSAISPEFAHYIVEFVLGEVLSRDVLDLHTRELVTIGLLAGMGTVETQLELHIAAALRNGATREEVVEVILQVAVYAGFAVATSALRVANRAFMGAGTASSDEYWGGQPPSDGAQG